MALLQDIEKSQSAVSRHRSNCNDDDAFLNIARRMKECLKMSSLMEDFLASLAKEVTQGNQKELTKEQEKLFDQVQRDLASTSVYTLWLSAGKYCENNCKAHMDVQDAFKRIK